VLYAFAFAFRSNSLTKIARRPITLENSKPTPTLENSDKGLTEIYLCFLFSSCNHVKVTYVAPIGRVIESFGIGYHQFADDTQLFVAVDMVDSADLTCVRLF